MASYPHPCNNHRSTCCCRCSCSSSHPSPPLSDSLLQIIASHLLQSSPSNLHSQYLKHQYQHQHLLQTQTQQQQTQSALLLQSLLRRVSALESSLHHLSSPSSHPHPPPPLLSLRDVAARTIQTRFRAFLVRRSQTLRNLKDLATIKSNFTSLKSSLLDNPDALSHKASDLLIKLDSIQGRDSLIRGGKRAIRCELVRFLESIEGSWAKCQSNPPPKSKKVTFAENLIHPTSEAAENVELVGGFKGIGGFSNVVETEDDGAHFRMEGFHHQISDKTNPRRNFMGGDSHAIGSIFQGQNGTLNLPPLLPVKPEEVCHGINGSFQGPNGSIDFHYPHAVPAMGYASFPWPINGGENYADGNLGLSAPVPVQMEKRGSDLLKKERAFDIPRTR